MRILAALLGTMLIAPICLAQNKDVTPLPEPEDKGLSLEITMKFIQDKLSDLGTVNYVTHQHNNVQGDNWNTRFSDEFTKVVANPQTCRIDFHRKVSLDGKVAFDKNLEIDLKDVENIVVMPLKQSQNQFNAKIGHPDWNVVKVNPTMYILSV